MNLAPSGRNVFAIATSDAHRVSAAYTGYTMMIMPENTVENLYNCMDAGEFFAASKCLGNHEELQEIAAYLINNGDEAAAEIGADILSRQAENYNAKYEAPLDVDAPVVNEILVNDAEDTIALDVVLTDELIKEGTVRDIIRQCQVARKDAGYQVEQRIKVAIAVDDEFVVNALNEKLAYIAGELLADAVLINEEMTADYTSEFNVNDKKIAVSVVKGE